MILFGVRSPIVVEYEETCARLGIRVSQGVSLSGASRQAGPAPTVSLDAFEAPEGAEFLACAFAPGRRRELVAMGRERGLSLASALVDPHAVLARSVRLGEGTFVNAGALVGAVTMIGEGVLVNRAASIGHHCLVQDYASLGPGATLAGNIHVGAGAVIGAGAVVLPNLRIGEGAIVAAGAVVRGHVRPGTLVAGHPARPHSHNPARSSLNVEDGE
jgi:sugar O-acyltransferase (sialic acid O-acetyltransferase NeuD family)